MKKLITLLSLFVMMFGIAASAADNTYLDYQNYNHGYCPDCDCAPCYCDQPSDTCPQQPCSPCDPCAPVCGAECGISFCAIGVGIAAVAAAAVIIIASGSGHSSSHSHG